VPQHPHILLERPRIQVLLKIDLEEAEDSNKVQPRERCLNDFLFHMTFPAL